MILPSTWRPVKGAARPGGWLGHKEAAIQPLRAARFDKFFDLRFYVRRQIRPGSNHRCQSRIISRHRYVSLYVSLFCFYLCNESALRP